MVWNGPLHKPSKYSETTFKGEKVGFVQLTKNAYYNDDGYLYEDYTVSLYDEYEMVIELYIPASNGLESYSLADYMLCDIQNTPNLNVQK